MSRIGLLDRLRPHATPPAPLPTVPKVTVYVVEDTHTFEGHEGETIWCGGYTPTTEDGMFLTEAEHRTTDPRAFYCKVAGAQHRPEALGNKRFALGSQIVLRADPDNAYDESAVGIWDAMGEVQVGYVPATLSADVAALMRSGTTLGGQVIREFRFGSSHGKRLGLHVIIAPVGPVSFIIDDQGELPE